MQSAVADTVNGSIVLGAAGTWCWLQARAWAVQLQRVAAGGVLAVFALEVLATATPR
ncbi:hypothetical protein [Kineococcus arenarius]|uniref:hypothetical protein n=1 Tax=unclassified Kineococcus TaxID=2621656 RepID=UPI003D7E327D